MDHLLWVVAFVLAVSFLSNISPFVGASYTLLTALQISLLGPTPFNFLLLVLVSAVGATLAKVAIYYGAFGLKGFLLKNRNVRLIGRYSTRMELYAALFVTSVLPVLPLDDFIYIGAGANSAPIGMMSLVTLGGKITKSGIEIALEIMILRDLSRIFGFDQLYVTAALTGIFVVIGVVLYKVDWEGTYARIRPGAPKPL